MGTKLLTCLVLCVFLGMVAYGALLMGNLTAMLGVIFLLTFGWAFFVVDVIPSVTVYWPSILTGIISFFFVLLGTHSTIRWFIEHSTRGDTTSRETWKFTWSVYVVALIVVAFVAGIAMTGFVHQVFWLIRDDIMNPWG